VVGGRPERESNCGVGSLLENDFDIVRRRPSQQHEIAARTIGSPAVELYNDPMRLPRQVIGMNAGMMTGRELVARAESPTSQISAPLVLIVPVPWPTAGAAPTNWSDFFQNSRRNPTEVISPRLLAALREYSSPVAAGRARIPTRQSRARLRQGRRRACPTRQTAGARTSRVARQRQ